MRHFTLTRLSVGIATAVCSLFAPADASALNAEKQIKWGRHRNGAFDSPRMRQIQAANAVLDGTKKAAGGLKRWAPAGTQTGEFKPAYEYKDLDYFGDLDGPDGKLWFYTANFDYDQVKHNENYTDYIMRNFRFDIYDADMKFVGSVQDSVRYAEGEVRVVQADLAPVVTRNFFNTDDKLEILVCLVYNTEWYVNNYNTKVYSVGGQKDEKGNDVCLATMATPVCDVLDAGTPGKEHFYISFMSEGSDYVAADDEDAADPMNNYWEKYTKYYTMVETYAPAVDEKGPRKINTYKVYTAQVPGDMENAPAQFSYMRDGQAYFATQYYEQPFFNPYGPTDDMTQREGNNLVVNIYKVSDAGFEKKQTSKIPVVRNTSDPKYIASFYSVGSLNYAGDIIGNEGSECDFIVTRQDQNSSTDSYENNFYRYNSKGERTNVVFENADGFTTLSDLPGQNPQMMFVNFDAYGDYQFNFVDMTTYETVLKQSYLMEMEDADPERLTTNMDRVAAGDSYMYAIEMRVPTVDDEDNNHLRVMWLDKNGKFDHIEEVNMGRNVNYAMVYISAATLNPRYFHSDDNREYMMLIKRATENGGSQEELLVAQAITREMPNGKNLLLLGQDEELGTMGTIVPYENYLMVAYKTLENKRERLAARYYMLPLDTPDGIGDVAGEAKGYGFRMAGNAITADGAIELFDLTGARVAGAQGSLSLEGLRPGIYVVRAGGKAAKVVVR